MSKLKVVITDHGPAGVEIERQIFGEAGYEIVAGACKTPADVIAIAADADALMVGGAPITADVINALTHCKIIIRYGVGVDCIDVEVASAKGIAVCNVPDATTDEVADHTIALALAWGRQLPSIDKRVRQGEWDVTRNLTMPPFEEMTFATVGFGNIARAVMERAKAFKFRLIGTDPKVPDEEFTRIGVERTELDDLIAQADILSLHPPLTKETHHMIDTTRFAQMKHGAILVNAGRGELIDT
ncbi:MAG TPA: C-terminal binding protein, partial [Abditibacteriaceae bacterium]|nr:C-terminal binding protein [Abditibacteriaceae bacterium]